MGNVQAMSGDSTSNNNKTKVQKNRNKKKKKNAQAQKSYRKTIRRSKRAKLTSTEVDMREIKTSRGSVKPHVASGTFWEDPCFPREMAMEGSRMEGMNYRWMRPKEFCKNPSLVDKKPSRHDVLQGAIGNCWMMATLAGIADYLPHLLQIIGGVDYDPSSGDYDGVFHCRFWHYGQWVNIYVDDCLPVQSNPGAPKGFSLIGARSPDPNVLWVALVEKSLAKFHGSYKAIEAREREYGWRLLTGGVPFIMEQEKLRQLPSDSLYERIKTSLDAGLVVTCSHQIGGGRLHAYTVTGAAHHSTKGNIIRVRNPWGEEKTRISWLETPERWPYSEDEDKEDFECREGEFWVMRGECYREFKQFCIGCFKANYFDAQTKESTILEHKYSCYGEWKGSTAAGNQTNEVFKNPKYKLKVSGSKARKILFELIPRPTVSNKGICMYIYKIKRLKSSFKATLCQNLMSADEKPVFLANGCPQFSYSLDPGLYMVVPLTQSSGDEREYCLRLYAKTGIHCQEITGTFFHQEPNSVRQSSRLTDSNENAPQYQHYPGRWKGDLFVNDQTFFSKLNKLTQYHISVQAETKLSIRVTQEFLSRDQYMKVVLYKTDQPISQVMDKSFYDEHTPRVHITPTRVQGPAFTEACTVEPACTYILLVCAWCAPEDRHYVVSLGWPAKQKVTVKSFNTS